ncbi:hypothetical protein [Caldalkalibacillus mannanilyticus]|uniref:hypothetical protein n=1 Tax=Caldalkalibacillus mannanilyticus TaxID=1418 RepID=UPI000469E706|nr:hypothetical protein [Caldalkalibacillus mannanilyticus]
MNQLKSVINHVSTLCANYAGNSQCLKDKPCPYFSVDWNYNRCNYYEHAVLPGKPALHRQYMARLCGEAAFDECDEPTWYEVSEYNALSDAGTVIKPKHPKRINKSRSQLDDITACKQCGDLFVRKSNAVKFCSAKCRGESNRASAAKRMRDYRSKSTLRVTKTDK